MDYKEIKQYVNMEVLLSKYGVAYAGKRIACPIHGGDNKSAFDVDNDLTMWNCHTKCGGGDIFTFVEKMDGLTNPQAKVRIMELFNLEDDKPIVTKPKKPKAERTVVGKSSYIYNGKDGVERYRINRVDYSDGGKACFPEHNGVRTLPQEMRTLYNLDRIYGTEDYVILCEGEKTADAVTSCGYIGTTNPLGSGNWEEEYASLLKGKKVVLFPDADEHGEEWREAVLTSLRGVVKQVQILSLPEKFVTDHEEFTGHDFADYLQIEGEEVATALLMDGIDTAKVMPSGIDASILGRPIDGFNEIIRKAKSGVRTDVFNMSRWLPSLDLVVNKGDLVVLMANTSTGKTRLLHNMPYFIRDVNYALFDLELSFETLCERYGAMENRISVRGFKEKAYAGYQLDAPKVDNVFIQKIERLTVEKIRERVGVLEEITKKDIHVVGIDYIGLMQGVGSSYESTSENVEAFKSYISDSGKVEVLTTQVSRPADKEQGMFQCPSPFSAKNSGSVENSSQLLIGFWKDQNDKKRLWARCLKYTHGEYPYQDIPLDANNLIITEATIDD